MMNPITRASAGTAQRNITESLEFILIAITSANMSIIGARQAERMNIMKAFCILVTSVVRRVVSEAVENLSTFANEKSCTLWKRSLLKFFAKPIAATALSLPANAPKLRDTIAIPTMRSPMPAT